MSEKCVLHVKSGKFHINLSFGLAQQCNRDKEKKQTKKNRMSNTEAESEKCKEEENSEQGGKDYKIKLK